VLIWPFIGGVMCGTILLFLLIALLIAGRSDDD
jgi:hypothetical protein